MKHKETKYTCASCGCKIKGHKVKWIDEAPYCGSCYRRAKKFGAVVSGPEYWQRIWIEEQSKL